MERTTIKEIPARVKGKVYKDRCTKDLAHRLKPGCIALIDHEDVDEMAVDSLLEARARAVLNTRSFFTGSFPLQSSFRLIEAGVLMLENVNDSLFELVEDSDYLCINGEEIWMQGKLLGKGRLFSEKDFLERFRQACEKKEDVWTEFLENTLQYIKNEKEIFLNRVKVPPLNTKMEGRDVVVVARGKGYREDLRILTDYLKEAQPVMVGVDGGGDALYRYGFKPDVVVGDMDSVSDAVLRGAGEVIVHTYQDNRASPGIKRVQELGVAYHSFSMPGTSEDIALILAYENGAALIVALGTHFGVTDFLEKGRKGMASTFLVRLKVAERLIDAKGVNRLYRKGNPWSLVGFMFLSALVPLLVLWIISPVIQHLLHLVALRLQFWF